jgi:hypothetical protein
MNRQQRRAAAARNKPTREKPASKEDLASWHSDKAVQDNIVESWLCVDCGVNTNPGSPSGPEIRLAFEMGAEGITLHCDRQNEVYQVKDAIWKQAGMRAWNGCLCIGCLERRIGRQLQPGDFARHDDEVYAAMPCTERLLNRRGYATVTVRTKDGPKEVICDIKDAPRIEGCFMEEGEAA